LRLARLARLVKLVKNLEAFDSLRVMIKSLYTCIPVLFWSSLVLFFVEVIVGLSLNNMLSPEIENPERSLSDRTELFKYFGTFSRSMTTMMELTLGNFVPVCRLLMENVSQGYGYSILIYKLIVGFGMLRVMSGVFLHETFKAAASDDELMVVQKKRAQEKHKKKMMRLFKAADPTGEGHIGRAEFAEMLQDQTVKTWLSAQDVEVGDGLLLFDLMDDGDHKLSPGELIRGMARLKGAARSIDLVGLMHLTSHLFSRVSRMDARVDGHLNSKLEQLNSKFEAKFSDIKQTTEFEL